MKKTELIKQMDSKGAFWSYDVSGSENVPDNILIEHALRWGDVPEILTLFKLFQKNKIKSVWETSLIPDKRIFPHNYYLARVFFDVDDAKTYILTLQKKNSRYEKLKALIT